MHVAIWTFVWIHGTFTVICRHPMPDELPWRLGWQCGRLPWTWLPVRHGRLAVLHAFLSAATLQPDPSDRLPDSHCQSPREFVRCNGINHLLLFLLGQLRRDFVRCNGIDHLLLFLLCQFRREFVRCNGLLLFLLWFRSSEREMEILYLDHLF